ncbi:transcription elongation factor GreA [Clostridium swellfunianum]|uniref:transcription elongation factor GreA n=1 Tax=Clostridium swellfunianum TaxID=1367462 RepID=UPI00202E93F5|nr:transcription elongation factor GreA [Clostridium swellfunianum]MCM0647871.1 transcription elongation factor GreA [Clostridium swellfunianum]
MHNYLTEEAINKLKEEIEHRKVVVRKHINEDLKEAKSHGDLSENFEYKSAKRDRARNESRIRYLERMIKTARIIEDTTANDEVGLGKKVTLRFLDDDDTEEFKIVTTIEADPMNNMISIESPIGKVIYKHKIGDKVNVVSPEGEYKVRIEKIELANKKSAEE